MSQPAAPRTVETHCENHTRAGSCTQECADLTNLMTEGPGADYPYDPTGCSEPAPAPETWFVLDTVKGRVAAQTLHPYLCSCPEHGKDDEPIPCPTCGGTGTWLSCQTCGGQREIMALVTT